MFFDDLSQKEIAILGEKGIPKHHIPGSYIIKEGASGTTFSIILSGEVEVRKFLSSTHSKAVAVLKECDVVGELGFFGVEARSADVMALTDCELLEFDREVFDDITDAYPKMGIKIYRNMARILAKRIANTDVELRDAIIWSIEKGIDRVRMSDIRQNYRLKLKK